MPARLIRLENRAGQTLQVGDKSLIPFASTVRLEFPGAAGGVIWNRPASLLIKNSDGSEQVIKLTDVTRQAQIALLIFGLVGSILMSILMRMVRKR